MNQIERLKIQRYVGVRRALHQRIRHQRKGRMVVPKS